MSPPKKQAALLTSVGAACAVLGMLGGAFSTWAATDRTLRVHIATATIRVRVMCQVAEYQMRATELMCGANGVACPRPVELKAEVLGRTCDEP